MGVRGGCSGWRMSRACDVGLQYRDRRMIVDDPVDRQLQAFNDRNLAILPKPFSPDVT